MFCARTFHPMTDRNAIRREMRSRRRQVTPAQRKSAARAFAVIADREYLLQPGRRIAAYLPFGHEADTSALIARAWNRGCRVYVPVISSVRDFRMDFVRFTPITRLRKNAFGISEPIFTARDCVAPLDLDVIFMPLVAFDARGSRLGSGAGFYDRRLHRLRPPREWRRPKLIGVAYSHQQSTHLRSDRWDVPMQAVITENAYLRFSAPEPGSRS
jgi:5-formyltetrahydrofolate cyclo-ligase